MERYTSWQAKTIHERCLSASVNVDSSGVGAFSANRVAPEFGVPAALGLGKVFRRSSQRRQASLLDRFEVTLCCHGPSDRKHPPIRALDTTFVKTLLANQFTQIAILLVIMLVIQTVSTVTGMWPAQFGVVPRTVTGLRGIIFSPMLHASWSHLIANTVPLAVLLGLLAFGKRHPLWATTAAIWVVTGLAVWLIGRPGSIQIGASGLIYALTTFFVTAAWTSRDLGSALVALIVIFLYGGLVWGLLPREPGVSWEGHIAGALAGILVARLAEKNRLGRAKAANRT